MERFSVRKEDLPVEESDGVESRSAELGEYTVAFEAKPVGFAVGAELLAGLAGDACHCPHWGVLLQGELRIPFTDGRVATIRPASFRDTTIETFTRKMVEQSSAGTGAMMRPSI